MSKPILTKSYETNIVHAYFVKYPTGTLCTCAIKDYTVPIGLIVRELQAVIDWLGDIDKENLL